MEELNLHLNPQNSDVTIRTGVATPPETPNSIKISSDITGPGNWLEDKLVPQTEAQLSQTKGVSFYGDKGPEFITKLKGSYVSFDFDSKTIKLSLEPEKMYNTTVTGKLEFDKRLEKFDINKPNQAISPAALSRKLKQLRHYATNRDVFDVIVAKLKNLEANVNGSISKSEDNGGNKKHNYEVLVSTNLDNRNFQIQVPIFKGEEPVVIPVEIVFSATSASDISVWLESIDLFEIVDKKVKEIFDRERERFDGIITIINK